MNSDFVQQQAEHLAQRVAAEPNNPARIRKLYSLVYGREPTAEEVQAGIEYLRAEPMKEYEEQKAAAEKKKAEKKDDKKSESSKPEADEPEKGDARSEFMPGGMMSGVGPRGRAPEEKKPQLPITAWGRYAKVLLSSSEFLFVN